MTIRDPSWLNDTEMTLPLWPLSVTIFGPEQRWLEPVEEGRLALFGHPPLKPVEGVIEHRKSPATVDPFCRAKA